MVLELVSQVSFVLIEFTQISLNTESQNFEQPNTDPNKTKITDRREFLFIFTKYAN